MYQANKTMSIFLKIISIIQKQSFSNSDTDISLGLVNDDGNLSMPDKFNVNNNIDKNKFTVQNFDKNKQDSNIFFMNKNIFKKNINSNLKAVVKESTSKKHRISKKELDNLKKLTRKN